MSDAKVTFQDEDWKPAAPGKEVFFSFACPLHKDRTCDTLPIRGRTTGGGPTWAWDGNRERPTFTPSINHQTCWHGFITAGRCLNTQRQDEPEPV